MCAATSNGFHLEDINFYLKKGECVALVGANGSGKTTLLKHLNGLYRPSSGRIAVCGQNALKLKTSQLARYIGTAFQNPNSQFFKLTVQDEIKVGAEVLDCYDEVWLAELVSLFRLKPLLKRSPHRLSGGEKKRVAFAAAMAAKPAILALDEPTAGQDGYFRKALGEFLIRLRRQGQAVLLITHDLAFAAQNTSRWLVMSRGKLIADEAPCKLIADRSLMRRAGLAV
jgi:energy-coupling factor transport system ATP-binding protein